MKPRELPYFWITWLTPLLAGEDSCEYKVWIKAHYTDVAEKKDDFNDWKLKHTKLLNEIIAEYRVVADQVMTENQTSWQIKGDTAVLSGKMDLVTINPNLVIDAKAGKQKDSHALQVRAYLLAINMGALGKTLKQLEFNGELIYGSSASDPVYVPQPNQEFRDRLFLLVKRLAGVKPPTTPSYQECKFCSIIDCADRITRSPTAAQTSEF
jgi:CRISPR/Cas system-associated exonuclease Cas4 (RecB family)